MPRILNYKSFYEAFKLGVVDDGFTPVARMLFEPLFDPDRDPPLCDENGELYKVTNRNASEWGNGTEPIPIAIQTDVGKKEALELIINHFSKKEFMDKIIFAKEDEMYEAMILLIQECEISETKKAALQKPYKERKYPEFLARVFQRALLGNNKVVSSTKKKKAADKGNESLDEFNELVRKKKKPKTTVPPKVLPPEMNYVMQLYAVYSIETGETITKAEDLDRFHYRKEFEHHRRNYYLAETVCRETRDTVRPGENSHIEALLTEMEEGTYEVWNDPGKTARKKVNAVMEQASKVQISTWVDDATNKWIGPGEKKGVCHILVNEERLKWVEE